MKLYEFEGKELYEKYGIPVPKRALVTSENEAQEVVSSWEGPAVIKAQILAGKRKKSNGIVFVDEPSGILTAWNELYHKEVRDELVENVLVEEAIDIDQESYVSFTYDTQTRGPILLLSKEGGIDIEELAEANKKAVLREPISIQAGLQPWRARELAKRAGFEGSDLGSLSKVLCKLYQCFIKEDARLVEINPLARTSEGEFIAVDAKVALDDDAQIRHKDRDYSIRTSLGRPPTAKELEAIQIDEGEDYYRGTASKYIELPGDIATLFAGGGASLIDMDALIRAGGEPANYTEYSGNPPREKVAALSRVVLDREGINGLWIVGGMANFTRVDETFAGILDTLRDLQPTYPIMIRRAGPFEEEGLRAFKEAADEHGWNVRIYGADTPMTDTAGELVEMVNAYKAEQGITA